MDRAEVTPTTTVTASQRFAALAGLPWSGPSDEQRAEFTDWINRGNELHAQAAERRAPGAPRAA